MVSESPFVPAGDSKGRANHPSGPLGALWQAPQMKNQKAMKELPQFAGLRGGGQFKREHAGQSFCVSAWTICLAPGVSLVSPKSGFSPSSCNEFEFKGQYNLRRGFCRQRQSRNPRISSNIAGSGVSVSVACSTNAAA